MTTPQHVHDFWFYLRWASGPVGTFVLGTGWWIMNKVADKLKTEWRQVTSRLERIESVQGVQAENHLKTIEANTGKTNEHLEKIEIGQAELNGYIKGFLNKA